MIHIILSVYFLALNLVPCNDADPPEDHLEITAEINSGTHGSPSGDMCSPFCECHCCHSFGIDLTLFVFQPFRVVIAQEEVAHFDRPGKDISLSILQPPRHSFSFIG